MLNYSNSNPIRTQSGLLFFYPLCTLRNVIDDCCKPSSKSTLCLDTTNNIRLFYVTPLSYIRRDIRHTTNKTDTIYSINQYQAVISDSSYTVYLKLMWALTDSTTVALQQLQIQEHHQRASCPKKGNRSRKKTGSDVCGSNQVVWCDGETICSEPFICSYCLKKGS